MLWLASAHRLLTTSWSQKTFFFVYFFLSYSLCIFLISRTLFLLFCGILPIVYSVHILYEQCVFCIKMHLFLICSVWRLNAPCRSQIFSAPSQEPPVTCRLNMAISHCPASCSSLCSVQTTLVLPDFSIRQSQEPPHTHTVTVGSSTGPVGSHWESHRALHAPVISFIMTSCPDQADQNFTAESLLVVLKWYDVTKASLANELKSALSTIYCF